MTPVSTVPYGEADEEATQPPFFSNVTREAGINFRHHNGMEDGHKQIPEDEGAGAAWIDYDGHQDFFAGNGHVETAEEALPPGETTFQPDVVFRNLGDCRFENVSNRLGPYFSEKHWSRAVVIGDYDNDGDQDVLVTVNNAEPILLRNDRGNANSWIQFRLVGEKDNREGIRAKVEITANGQTQYREVRRVDGYCSSHDVRAHFGLGDAEKVTSLSVLWPDGSRQKSGELDARRLYVIHQSKDILPPASPAAP